VLPVLSARSPQIVLHLREQEESRAGQEDQPRSPAPCEKFVPPESVHVVFPECDVICGQSPQAGPILLAALDALLLPSVKSVNRDEDGWNSLRRSSGVVARVTGAVALGRPPELLTAPCGALHCIEDLHMPLHVGDNKDKGGNLTQVRWYDRVSNMHRVWDSGIIERAGTTEEFWLDNLAELDAGENLIAKPHVSASFHSTKLPFLSDCPFRDLSALSHHRFHVIEFYRWVEWTTIHLIHHENGSSRLRPEGRCPSPAHGNQLTEGLS
jgi:S1/P1 Nuclease